MDKDPDINLSDGPPHTAYILATFGAPVRIGAFVTVPVIVLVLSFKNAIGYQRL
jgi:hypothetical protein